MQALRGSVVDAVLVIGYVWRTTSYTRALTQALADRLNASGFRVQQIDDSNLALLSGGTMKVRAEINSNGYASERDAASVIAGAASALGYNVQQFAGALVSSGPGGSAVTYRENALDRDTTTGLPSGREIIPEIPDLSAGQLAAIGLGLFGLILLLRR
jgi:hypothetical protein